MNADKTRKNGSGKRKEPADNDPPMSSTEEDEDMRSFDDSSASRELKRKRQSSSPAAKGYREERRLRPARTANSKSRKTVVATFAEDGKSDSDDATRTANMFKSEFRRTTAKKVTGLQSTNRLRQPVNQRESSATEEGDETTTNAVLVASSGGGTDFMAGRNRKRSTTTYASSRGRQISQRSSQKKPKLVRRGSSEGSPQPEFIRPKALDLSDTGASPVARTRPTKRSQRLPPRSPPSPGASFMMPRRLSDSESRLSQNHSLNNLLVPNAASGDEPWDSSGRPVSSARSLSPLSDLESLLEDSPACPMCHELVDQMLLDDFKRKHPRMSIAQQRRFCDLHIAVSARRTWSQRGYPDIDWSGMDSRIAKHHDFLRHILKGGKSYYTDIFNKKVKAGKDKTTVKSQKSLTPGYYGPRGLRVITDNIMEEFSQLLVERPLEDRLIAARGRVAYVQSVLVPEVAVKLIMEDMKVAEDQARSIIVDSASVGDVLNEETEDMDQFRAMPSDNEELDD